jgi:hypothetical protein
MTATVRKPLASRISRWSLTLVLAFGSLVWITLNVWTAPTGILWHVFHGRATAFGSQKIVVPWDMWVDRPNQSLMIIREPAKYRLVNSPWGTIVLVRGRGQPTSPTSNYSRIARSEEQLPEGFRLQLVREVRSGKQRGLCWESSRIGTPEPMISCHFDNDTLSATFNGTSKYSDAFYSAISAAAPK